MPLDNHISHLDHSQLLRVALLEEMLDHCKDTALALVLAQEAEAWIVGPVEIAVARIDSPHAIEIIVSDDKAKAVETAAPEPISPESSGRPDVTDDPALCPDSPEPQSARSEEPAPELRPLYPSEREILAKLRRNFGDREFAPSEAVSVVGKAKGTVAPALAILLKHGLLSRPAYGLYQVLAQDDETNPERVQSSSEPVAIPATPPVAESEARSSNWNRASFPPSYRATNTFDPKSDEARQLIEQHVATKGVSHRPTFDDDVINELYPAFVARGHSLCMSANRKSYVGDGFKHMTRGETRAWMQLVIEQEKPIKPVSDTKGGV